MVPLVFENVDKIQSMLVLFHVFNFNFLFFQIFIFSIYSATIKYCGCFFFYQVCHIS